MSTILITGASSGIGRELALKLSAPGQTLVLVGLNEERLAKTATQATEAGAQVIQYACDLTNFASIEKWYTSLKSDGIQIDTLYLNAGRNTFGRVHKTPLEDLLWVYEVNILSVAQWISLVYPDMKRRKSGQIIILSSLAGYSGLVLSAPYAASKRALQTLCVSLWPEAEDDGIDLNIVSPGFIKTRIFHVSRFSECDYTHINQGIKNLGFPIISVEQAVQSILKGVRSKKKNIIFPFYAKLMALQAERLPFLTDIAHRRFLKLTGFAPTTPVRLKHSEDIQGKTCVVTGAASGIGKELTLQLLQAGAKVYALDISVVGLESISFEDNLEILQADVTDVKSMQRAADQIHAKGHVDLLINNAGITLIKETSRVSFAEWKYVLDVNYLGTLHGIHVFYPHMVQREDGHIVNVASIAGHSGYASAVAYATSKSAILGFTRTMKVEAAMHGVRVSAALPSYVKSSIFDTAQKKGWSPQSIDTTFLTKPISSADAAAAILSGIKKGKEKIIFPLSGKCLYFITNWLTFAVQPLQKRLLKKYKAMSSIHKESNQTPS